MNADTGRHVFTGKELKGIILEGLGTQPCIHLTDTCRWVRVLAVFVLCVCKRISNRGSRIALDRRGELDSNKQGT